MSKRITRFNPTYSRLKDLCSSISTSCTAIEELLLSHPEIGINTQCEGDSNMSLLHIAAAKGRGEIVKLLLSWPNIDPNLITMAGATPVCKACVEGNYDALMVLLKDSRVSVRKADCLNCTPLFWAITSGFLRGVKLLLASGRDLNFWAQSGWYACPGNCTALEAVKRMYPSGSPIVTLLENYQKDPVQSRVNLRKELGIKNMNEEAQLFAIGTLCRQGYLEFKFGLTDYWLPRERFFKIFANLPPELQMLVCNLACNNTGPFISNDCIKTEIIMILSDGL